MHVNMVQAMLFGQGGHEGELTLEHSFITTAAVGKYRVALHMVHTHDTW